MVVGRTLESIVADFAAFWYELVGDGQLRWVGPEKGVIHLATAAVVNAVWDLYAKSERQAALEAPRGHVARGARPARSRSATSRDALTPDEALEILRRQAPTRAVREAEMRAEGYPAYTTSTGWLGYSDEKVRRLCRDGVADGWRHFKVKVGVDMAADIRRVGIVREEIGPDRVLMVDANQAWDVDQAIEWMQALAPARPWWIEEPTSPDDVLGHARIARALEPLGIRVATGEHAHNRVMFKQFLQAERDRVLPDRQLPARRGQRGARGPAAGGQVRRARSVPHAGGVGLCEYVQHLAIFDYIAVSGSLEDRVVEYVDHLHEHFVDPAVVRDGRYVAPTAPGYSITMRPASLETLRVPGGAAWAPAGRPRRRPMSDRLAGKVA